MKPTKYKTKSKLVSIIFSHFIFKMLGGFTFTTVFFGFYLYLLKNPVYSVVIMPTTWIDDLIHFAPIALVPYVSLWVYVSLPVFLLQSRMEIFRYGVWIAALCSLALLVFYLFPTAVPPADIDWSLYPGVAFLKNVDAAGNACPSLHVGTAIFTAMWLHHFAGRLRLQPQLVWLNVFWAIAIVYSTMATKQHVSIDVMAGAALGALMAWLSIRSFERP